MSSTARPAGSSSPAGRARSGAAPAGRWPSGPAPSGEVPDAPADPEEVARQICLELLTAAPRTRAQLAAALSRRRVPDEAAEAVLDRFADVRLIDDALYAQAWVDSRHRGRGLARRALAAELRQRGVAGDDIQEAVGRLDPEQELATARALVDKRLPATRALPKPARFRRLMGMLARKGYSEGVAYRIVSEALRDEPSGPELSWAGDELPGPEPDGQPTDW